MGRIRRKFEPEFKLRIAQQVLSGENTQNALAREYGIAPCVIRHWVKKIEDGEMLSSGPSMQERRLQEENRQLKEKLAELYMQVELLKKIPSFVQSQRSARSSVVTSSNLARLRGDAK